VHQVSTAPTHWSTRLAVTTGIGQIDAPHLISGIDARRCTVEIEGRDVTGDGRARPHPFGRAQSASSTSSST